MTDDAGRMHPGDTDGAENATVTDPVEIAQIMRLDDALQRQASGLVPDLDPREDPELATLLATALAMDDTFAAAADTHSFHSFRHRSRAAILHALEAEQPVPLRERIRVVVAAAAGLAALVIGVASFGGPALDTIRGNEGSQPGVTVAVPNLTERSSQEQLSRLSAAVQGIRESANTGQPLTSATLREFTETAVSFANAIEREPNSVSPDAVLQYQQSAQEVQAALASRQAEPGSEDAAAAAAHAAEDAMTVATRWLGGSVTDEPKAGDETPTATATATATATPTESPTATGTPTATPTVDPDETATPDAEPTGTATPSTTPSTTPSATPDGSDETDLE